MESYKPSHLATGESETLKETYRLLDREVPVSGEELNRKTGIRPWSYKETLEKQGYTFLEKNGELYLDKKISAEDLEMN